MRLIRAYLAMLAAGLEKWVVETTENTKKFPEREYWRGYEDGHRDGRAAPRQSYPNE